MSRIVATGQALIKQAPLFALFSVLIPIGSCVFLINAGVQSVRSRHRIRLHEQGQSGVGLGSYRVPLMIESARGAMEGAMENLSARRSSMSQGNAIAAGAMHNGSDSQSEKDNPKRYMGGLNQIDILPTLRLTEEQFAIIDSLDKVGFKKYRVYISKVRHTHAAIIVRMKRGGV